MPIHHLVSLLLQLSLVYPVGRPIPNCKMQYSWYMGSSNRVILARKFSSLRQSGSLCYIICYTVGVNAQLCFSMSYINFLLIFCQTCLGAALEIHKVLKFVQARHYVSILSMCPS